MMAGGKGSFKKRKRKKDNNKNAINRSGNNLKSKT